MVSTLASHARGRGFDSHLTLFSEWTRWWQNDGRKSKHHYIFRRSLRSLGGYNDTKSFYAYVRSKAKAKVNVGPLVNKDGEVISLAEDMSEEFNKFFISVFTNEGNESIPEAE